MYMFSLTALHSSFSFFLYLFFLPPFFQTRSCYVAWTGLKLLTLTCLLLARADISKPSHVYTSASNLMPQQSVQSMATPFLSLSLQQCSPTLFPCSSSFSYAGNCVRGLEVDRLSSSRKESFNYQLSLQKILWSIFSPR